MNKKDLIIVAFMAFSVLFLCGAVSATNQTVIPGPNAIQNAVNTAHNGDNLSLTTGTFNEHDILVKKNLTIYGVKPVANYPSNTIIDGQNLGRVFIIPQGFNVTLKYLTIQNGYADNDASDPNGGGILNSGNLIVDTCFINHNTAFIGGGIENNGGTLKVSNSYVYDNIAEDRGAGISNYYDSTATIQNTNVFSNIAGSNGGGIVNSGNMILDGCNVYNNAAFEAGGGINNIATLNIINSNIFNNTAGTVNESGYGGGIHNVETLTINKTNVFNNTAGVVNPQVLIKVPSYGGGIYNIGYICDIINSNIIDNKAGSIRQLGYGGGILDNWIMTLTNSIVSRNYANDTGGGIYENDTITIKNSTISLNIATNASGIYNNGTVNLYNSQITSNIARINGGGIFNDGNMSISGTKINQNKAYQSGGGIFNENMINLNSSKIYYNSAKDGSGVYNTGKMNIKSSNLYINTANSNGGGIFNNGTLNINNTSIYQNKAISSNGGGINNIGNCTINNSTINSNTASRNGGGIFNNGNLTITNSNVNYNIAKIGGGIYEIYHLDVIGSNITSNKATYAYNDIYSVPPVIQTINPVNGATDVATNTVITIKFSESVKWGSKWIEIQANGITIPTSDFNMALSSDGKTLNITPTSSWTANTTYAIIFHTGCVKDYDDKNLAVTTRTFTTVST